MTKLYYSETSCGAANFIAAHTAGVQMECEQARSYPKRARSDRKRASERMHVTAHDAGCCTGSHATCQEEKRWRFFTSLVALACDRLTCRRTRPGAASTSSPLIRKVRPRVSGAPLTYGKKEGSRAISKAL